MMIYKILMSPLYIPTALIISVSYTQSLASDVVTFPLNVSCGYNKGYCECVVPGRPGVPNAHAAELICKEFGYDNLVSYQTVPGPTEAVHCWGIRSSDCYLNPSNGATNLICTSVTCSK